MILEFGQAMTIASSGVLVELIDDAVTIPLPAGEAEIEAALYRLKVSHLIDGFRQKARGNRGQVVGAVDVLMRAAFP